jgi:hypothetical protein
VRTVALLGLGLLLAAAAAAGPPRAAGLPPGRAIIRLSALTISDTNVRLRRAGETGVATYHLYNRALRATSLGSAIVSCRYLGAGGILGSGVAQCQATFTLPRGALLAVGLVRRKLVYQLVVLGGTGAYANVAGTVIVERSGSRPDRGDELQLLFQLSAT